MTTPEINPRNTTDVPATGTPGAAMTTGEQPAGEPSLEKPEEGSLPEKPSLPVGERIRRKREACGLSRYEFEKRCGVSATTIQTLELGRQVKDSTLAKMETCLDALLAKNRESEHRDTMEGRVIAGTRTRYKSDL